MNNIRDALDRIKKTDNLIKIQQLNNAIPSQQRIKDLEIVIGSHIDYLIELYKEYTKKFFYPDFYNPNELSITQVLANLNKASSV